uniref:Tryptophan synthase alpha chain n=1 Tax=Ophidocladus simpliciusculus TaxID=1261574 RepID=A0A1Z1MJK8_9FLOR|nr:Tryptophan synthase alpha subunit [Ophidocladus simpliciusculus]ARW65941.1 Tryptophan synthase alpha subunit [Ophidocladus simpliciusculus]
MNSISQILQEKRKKSTSALIPFVTAGYPNINMTKQILYTLDKKGADIIELGVPYSDSLADGPLIQKSSKVALEQGVYINQVLSILSEVQFKLKAPIIIFTYYNPILVRGTNRFISEISQLGIKGLVIPDLPIEETEYITHLCILFNIELILFIAPTSSKDRVCNILSKAPGCVYLVSNTGVTGIRHQVSNNIDILSSYIKSYTSKLVMLGFGISTSSQVSQISQWNIDGIVVGSAFIRILSSNLSSEEKLENLGSFCMEMKSSIVF